MQLFQLGKLSLSLRLKIHKIIVSASPLPFPRKRESISQLDTATARRMDSRLRGNDIRYRNDKGSRKDIKQGNDIRCGIT